MEQKDYYEILSVEEDASQDDIKKSYRRLAKKYHPDANPDNLEAEAQFKDVSEAYDHLGDEEKRNQYDGMRKMGVAGVSPDAFEELFRKAPGSTDADEGSEENDQTQTVVKDSPEGSFFNEFGKAAHEAGNIFSQFFKGDGEAETAGPARGENLQEEIDVFLDEAIKGAKKHIEVKLNQPCPTCSGSGARSGTTSKGCAVCQGLGVVPVSQGGFSLSKSCPLCRGRGKIIQDPCEDCEGRGTVRSIQKLLIPIPAGVEEGQKLKVAGRGRPGIQGGPPGDLILDVHIQDTEEFWREGDTVHSSVTVNVAQAMLGAKVPVKTVDGMLKITIPAGTHHGAKLRIKGHGLFTKNGARGDQVVEVSIHIPTAKTNDQKEVVQDLADEFDLEM